jgi:BlaI family transcriptional regulator, penicillinase repressor
MAHNQSRPRLSAGEMRLMALLWDRGPLTLSEVHEAHDRDVGQTTVQNQLARLLVKGVVSKSEDRPAKYIACVERHQISEGFLDLLVETVGQGKILPLVAQLVSRAKLSPDDVAELQRLIDGANQPSKKPRSKGKRNV